MANKYFFNTQISSTKYYFNTIAQSFRFNTELAPTKYYFNTADIVNIDSYIKIAVEEPIKIISYFNTSLESNKYYFNVINVGDASNIETNYIVNLRDLTSLELLRINAQSVSEKIVLGLLDDVSYNIKLGKFCLSDLEKLTAYHLLFEYLTDIKQRLIEDKQYNIVHPSFFYKELYKLDDIKLWFTKRNLPIQYVYDAFGIETYLVDKNAYPKLDTIFGNDEGIFTDIFE